MPAETNLIKREDMVRAREIQWIHRFTEDSLKKFMEAVGVTRKIPYQEGTTLAYYKTVGTLEDGNVGEGEIIPLSHYERIRIPVGEIGLNKWRKATSAEAILKSGLQEAVGETDTKMLKDIQTSIRTNLFSHIQECGTTWVRNTTLQAVLAKTWGNLQVLFENDAVEVVHFINPLTIADYLATASITVQTAFGFNYIENFLGLGTVIMTSIIPVGKVASTAKDNIIMYYVPVSASAMSEFGLRADPTGFIGFRSGFVTHERAQLESMAMSGITFMVEYADGVVYGMIGEESDETTATFGTVTVTSEAGDASGTSEITLSGYTLKAGEKFVYKTGAANAPAVTLDQKLGTTWKTVESGDSIVATSGHKITVAAVNADGKAKAAGSATVVSAA